MDKLTCPYCGKQCNRKYNLETHIQSAHGTGLKGGQHNVTRTPIKNTMFARIIDDEEIINNNELLKEEIAQVMRNAMTRFDQPIKWNIAFDIIFEKVETRQTTMPHPTFHDTATPLFNINKIDDKITNSFIKRDNDIENFVHNVSGWRFVKTH